MPQEILVDEILAAERLQRPTMVRLPDVQKNPATIQLWRHVRSLLRVPIARRPSHFPPLPSLDPVQSAPLPASLPLARVGRIHAVVHR